MTEDDLPAGQAWLRLHRVARWWRQWRRWTDYPVEAMAMGACDGELGIDCAIGAPAWTDRRAGTMLIAALMVEARHDHLGAGGIDSP